MHPFVFPLALAFYYAIHSLLATESSKAIANQWPPLGRYYRLLYNVVAVSMLFIVYRCYLLGEKTPLFERSPVLLFVGIGAATWGLYIAISAFKGYDKAEFFGYDALRKHAKPLPQTLLTTGWNARVRHPLYFATILVVWAAVLVFPNTAMLYASLVTTAYLYVGTRLEEQKLLRQFGHAYREYQDRVPMLIPTIGRRKV